MKLVIDAVTTPLLHERLGRAASYRERAALLRSLAEAALRGDQAKPIAISSVEAHAAPPEEMLTPHNTTFANSQRSNANAEFLVAPTGYTVALNANEAQACEGHDVEQIADAFGSFF
ncbi:hypothetical protein [Paraburkholderia fungorum]|nr:hypothetical protein [Paraburkholderia fungorum]